MKLASLLSAFLLLSELTIADAKPVQQVLVISDIHFNPLANLALVPQLIAAEPSEWEAVFAADTQVPPEKYNEDSSYSLLATLVSGIRDIQPRPKVIILTGDVLPHKFQNQFAGASRSSDPAAFRSFEKKTFAFIAGELTKAAQGIPVIYTLGNNDQDCGDYALQPSGPFLQDTAEMVQALAQVKTEAMTNWVSQGSYVASNPVARRHRVVALNSNFWSTRYVNSCADKANQSDPGQSVLTWLAVQLDDAEKQGDKVWLAYHIPPGIDGHTSSKTKQVTPFFKSQYADGFNSLLDRYRKTIELNLTGHTHLDDFRLVRTKHTETLVIVNPGVSRNVGQNPAFRLISVDGNGRPVDINTYFLPKLDAKKWELEYSTRPAYSLKKLDARSYSVLYRNIETSPVISHKWRLYYSVSRPSALSDDKDYLRSLYCATGNVSQGAFQSCLTSNAP